jgi:hypothetical protein
MIGVGILAYNGKCEESYRAMVAAAPAPPLAAATAGLIPENTQKAAPPLADEAMVDAFCRSYWGPDWVGNRFDTAEDESGIKQTIHDALNAALATRPPAAATPEPQGDCCLQRKTNCGDHLCPLPENAVAATASAGDGERKDHCPYCGCLPIGPMVCCDAYYTATERLEFVTKAQGEAIRACRKGAPNV